MFAPMFDGQYRSRPRVSLRGASRQEEGGTSLLQRVHYEREERDLVRRKLHAAVTIQAYYRGHATRQKLYSNLRTEFDELSVACRSVSCVQALSRLLLMFYQQHTDQERLVLLCQKWLQFKNDLASFACVNPVCAYHLHRVLVLTCHSLHSSPTQPLACPLRMIEVFTDPRSYPSRVDGETFTQLLFRHLTDSGYFQSLRRVLETRVPPPDQPSLSPSPLAASILDYISRPVNTGSEGQRSYPSLASELFCPPLTAHTCYLLLPHLSTLSFTIPSLLLTLTTSLTSGEVAATPALLYTVIHLLHNSLDSLPQPSLTGYLRLLALLLNYAPREDHVTSGDRGGPEEYEEEEEDEGEPDPLGSRQELLAYCCNTLCGGQIPYRIRQERIWGKDLLEGLCSLCYQLISHDKGSTLHSRSKLFQQLALTPSLLPPLWTNITCMTTARTFGEAVSCLQQLSRGALLPACLAVSLMEQLSVFSTLFSLYLSTLHDSEFYGSNKGSHMPFSVGDLVQMVSVLRDVFISVHMAKHSSPLLAWRGREEGRPASWQWASLNQCLLLVLLGLYEKDCRRPFCPPNHWEVLTMSHIPPQLFLEPEEGEEGEMLPIVPETVSKQAQLLKTAPFVFPFIERVKFFQQLVANDRRSVQGQLQDFLMGPGLHVTARRNHIYEDAFSKLSHGEDLRQKLRVNLVNAQGLDEPGIDGGGLFREFLNELLKTGFDPNHGYFSSTQDGLLYPNPQAHFLNDGFAIHYHFLGGMLGKALYENLLVELPFAGFFLCKLTNRGRGSVGSHHLASLDPELYRHLLSLKHSEGDIEDLSLNFTVVNNEFGRTKVVELKRGGTNIPVTRSNCIEYIHLVAYYRLNVQIERQFQAFRKGLSAVIPVQWLGLFNQRELQVLISGAEVPIDINDLRRHTVYAGGFTPEHECVHMFWDVVGEFTEEQKRELLKFVTSCSRRPLLGFKDLHPAFCVLSGGKEDRLPSASTCMNILKLPVFQDSATMKTRLVYAISSGAGFELS